MSTTHPQIKAQRRTASGSGAARQLRRTGFVPATIYGHSMKAESLQVEERSLRVVLHQATSANFVVDLAIEGEGNAKPEKRLAIVQARQVDALTKQLLHVDFHGVSADDNITAHVALEFIGNPLGAKRGGLTDVILHELEITCKPDDLPESIQVDINHLEVGDSLHIGDIKLPKGVTATGDPGTPVVACTEPRVNTSSAEADATVADAAAAANAAAAPEAG